MRRSLVLVLALAAAATLAGSAAPTHGRNVWSGNWTTNTGTLGLRWIADAAGAKAIQSFGGQPCAEPTDYFRGGYTTGAGDHGGVVGCTAGRTRLIARWNTNLATARDGTFDVRYSGGGFSGRYQEDNGGAGSYTGTFKGHFAGDGADAGDAASTTVTFSFRTHANNVQVVAPLVGRFQLGVANATGSGKLTFLNGVPSGAGTLRIVSDPLLPQYPTRTMSAKVIGAAFSEPAEGTRRLTLRVEITAHSHPEIDCAPGTVGILKLQDTQAVLSNGQKGDYVTLGSWQSKCPSFVMGWTNADGGARTSPATGGPPSGGQWAVVNISAS